MCSHAMLLRRTAVDHVQLVLHKKYKNKGVFHKKQAEMSVYVSHICAHMEKQTGEKNFRYKKGYHFMQQPMQVNILWLQNALAMLSPSLRLATFWCTYYQHKLQHTTSCTDTDCPSYYTAVWSLEHTRHCLKVYSTHMHCAINHQLLGGLDTVKKWPLAIHLK